MDTNIIPFTEEQFDEIEAYMNYEPTEEDLAAAHTAHIRLEARLITDKGKAHRYVHAGDSPRQRRNTHPHRADPPPHSVPRHTKVLQAEASFIPLHANLIWY